MQCPSNSGFSIKKKVSILFLHQRGYTLGKHCHLNKLKKARKCQPVNQRDLAFAQFSDTTLLLSIVASCVAVYLLASPFSGGIAGKIAQS